MTHSERIALLGRLQDIAITMKNENIICNSANERINSPAGSLNSMPEVKKTNLAYFEVHEIELEKNKKLYLFELKSFVEKEGVMPNPQNFDFLGIVECHSELER